MCSLEEWAGADPFYHPPFTLRQSSEESRPCPFSSRDQPKAVVPDQELDRTTLGNWRWRGTGAWASTQTAQLSAPPCLDPFFKAMELWPACHYQHRTSTAHRKGNEPLHLSSSDQNATRGLTVHSQDLTPQSTGRGTRNVQTCLSALTYIPKTEPRSHGDADAHLFF